MLALIGILLSQYAASDWRIGDVALYHGYALGFWHAPAHPLLPAEYPPLSVLPFGLSLIGPAAWYPDVFALSMATIVVLGYLGFRRWVSPGQATAYALYALAAGVATLVFRYDVVPALLAGGAVWCTQRSRYPAAYALLAIAILLKIYPIVLVPVVAIAQLRETGHRGATMPRQVLVGAGACVGAVALGFAVAQLIDPTHGLGSLTYQLSRPTELESVPATLLWLGTLAGQPVSADWSYGAYNLAGGLGSSITIAMDVMLVAGLLFVYSRQRGGRMTTAQAATAAVLVLLCTSKVLSAQYLLWLAPLLATAVGFQLRWFFVCLLTALVFPGLFEVGIHHQGVTTTYSTFLLVGIAVRNVALIACAARFMFAPGADRGLQRHASAVTPARLHPRMT